MTPNNDEDEIIIETEPLDSNTNGSVPSIQTERHPEIKQDVPDLNISLAQYRDKFFDQELTERIDTHGIRKDHLARLFILTVVWIVMVWLIVLLQGFGGFITFMPSLMPNLFKLSDSVLIAFMTTTTTTVLGLYGIAAYWLYGKKKDEPKDDKSDSNK